jgi:hypothetical protein
MTWHPACIKKISALRRIVLLSSITMTRAPDKVLLSATQTSMIIYHLFMLPWVTCFRARCLPGFYARVRPNRHQPVLQHKTKIKLPCGERPTASPPPGKIS